MNSDAISNLIFLFLLAAVGLHWILRRFWQKQATAKLVLPNGRAYTYVVGDYMRSYGAGGTFHGIDVILPKEMPHIYLDSLRGGGRRAQFVIDPSQYIQLEGNFNRYYRVFVPKKHEVIALSILAPDVMATLQDHATAFDVEIYGSRMRVISNKRVMSNPALQAAALSVATKVMEEIDHRLQSWSKSGSLEARGQDLVLYPTGGVRIFGRSVTYWTIGWSFYWFMATIGLALVGALAVLYPETRGLGIFILGFFAVFLVVMLVGTRLYLKKNSFRSRRD